jgi:anti-anti-sigma factor
MTEILIADEADIVCVSLSGRLDAPGVAAVELKFTAAVTMPGSRVLVDLSGVPFAASLAIRLLLTVAKTVQKHGGKLVLCAPTPEVAQVLAIAAIDRIVPVVADVAAGRALL